MINTLAVILAGGEGRRLHPLTSHRAKPAVPFGARYRIVDFALSNFINSGFFRIKVLTQYLSNSLLIHLSRGYNFGTLTENFADPIPAQLGVGEETWYRGTADAIYQNLGVITDERPNDVAIFGGDHIYKMDIRQMLNHHRLKQAACTVAALPFDRAEAAGKFGVIEVDPDWRIIGFQEKPADPRPIPGHPDLALVSMGNYFFTVAALQEVLGRDHCDEVSDHDFGKNILPAMVGNYPLYAYNFLDNRVPGQSARERGYWRDVGTVDAYFDANMDLCAVSPQLDLYNADWPIRSTTLQFPPAKFVFDESGRRGHAVDSVVANGCIISGSRVAHSVVFNNVFVHSYSNIERCLLMQGCNIGRKVELRGVICDKFVTIEDGTVIGEDRAADRERFHVTEGGLVVIPKGTTVPREGALIPPDHLPPPGTIRPRLHVPGSVSITPEEQE